MEVIATNVSWGFPSDTSAAMDDFAMQIQVAVTAAIAICSGVSINKWPSDIANRQVLIKDS